MPQLLFLQLDQGLLLIRAQCLLMLQLDGVQVCCILLVVPSQLCYCVMLLGCLLLQFCTVSLCCVWPEGYMSNASRLCM